MNEIIKQSLNKLKEKKILNPYLDLKILLKEASLDKKDIILSNLNIDHIDLEYLKKLISRRLNDEPVSKIVKKKYFWKNEFYVNSDVLDPRPESEIIIEEVLSNINDTDKKIKILDIGTGSGCLAISIAKELKNSQITAIDISEKAIEVAKKNIKINNVESQIKLLQCDFNNISEEYDFIITNPPYVNENDYQKLHLGIKKYEPKIALIGGNDGLEFYRLFAKKIEKIMKNNSYFICEIGYDQLDACKKIFNESNLLLCKVSKDIQKIDRTLTFLKI